MARPPITVPAYARSFFFLVALAGGAGQLRSTLVPLGPGRRPWKSQPSYAVPKIARKSDQPGGVGGSAWSRARTS